MRTEDPSAEHRKGIVPDQREAALVRSERKGSCQPAQAGWSVRRSERIAP